MNGFIFASGVHQPGYPNDADGVFRPGAEGVKKLHGIPQPICYFDWQSSAADKRRTILSALRSVQCDDPDGLDVVAYFGHGVKDGLSSADIYKGQVQELAFAIGSVSKWNVRVDVYASPAGLVQDSFGQALSSALASPESAVFGHTTARHAFANPDVTVFTGNAGRWVVALDSPDRAAWVAAIKAGDSIPVTKNPLWAQFPFMGEDEIKARNGNFVAGGASRPSGGW